MHDYKEWNKVLCKELLDHMEEYTKCPNVDELCRVEKLAKTIVKMQEMETYDLMFKCLEDCFGYDREKGEFEDKDGGSEMMMYAIYNAYSPARMNKRGMGDYTTTYRGGQSMRRGYDRGVMNGDRYGEYSSDKSMHPYHEYGYGMMDGYMNAYDGRSERMYDSRTGEYRTDGNRDGDRYMNASRGRDGRSIRDSRRERDSRGRFMNLAEHHMEEKQKMKKLTENEKREWLENLENADGTTGPMWDKEQTTAVAKKIGIKFDEFSESDFNVAMNVMYSDYCEAIEKAGINKPEVYARLAKAFLTDEDGPDGAKKLSLYFKNIVEAEDDG